MGGRSDAYFGSSVSTAGDVNGDGFSDVIQLATPGSQRNNAGSVGLLERAQRRRIRGIESNHDQHVARRKLNSRAKGATP